MSMVFFNACVNNKLEEAKELFNDGIDLSFSALGGNTALILSAYKGFEDVVKWLIKIGSPLEAKNNEEKTALIRAAFGGHSGIVDALIEAGADVNAADKEGKTAVIYAINNNHKETALSLIGHGAELTAPDSTGHTAMDYAKRRNMLDLISQARELCGGKPDESESEIFNDFNFKLIVIEALLNKSPSFEAKLEALKETSAPQIAEFFKNLRLTQEDLDKVETLVFDSGNEIYYLINPDWDGRKEDFEVKSTEGFKHLKNLKSINYICMCDEELTFPILEYIEEREKKNFLEILTKNNITNLETAIKKNNPEAARYYINRGESVNKREYMLEAIEQKSALIIKLLIESDFDLTDNKNTFYIEKLLHRFSNNIDEAMEVFPLFIDAVEELSFKEVADLTRGAKWEILPDEYCALILEKWGDINRQNETNDIQESDRKGETLLHHMLWLHSYCNDRNTGNNKLDKFIGVILDKDDVDINTLSDKEMPPLYNACAYASAEIVQKLLVMGADYSALCGKQSEPLTLVAAKFDKAAAIEVLCRFGADINAADKNGCTALHAACMKRDSELINLLFNLGADPAVTDKNGDTPFHLLFSVFTNPYSHNISYWNRKVIPFAEYKKMIDLFTEKGAYLEAVNNNLRTPFFEYCYSNKETDALVFKHLISLGVSVDFQDKDDRTPLFYAVKRDNINLAKLLLENGADANIKNNEGVSPYQIALENNKRSVISMIEKSSVTLEMDGDDLDAAFIRACKNGKRGVAEMLMKSGNIDVTNVDNFGRTPLHYIAGLGSLALAKFAVNNGVDVNYTDHDGKTALHFAANNQHKEVFKLLLENGADANIADDKGVLPIHLITNRGLHDLLAVMLEQGADTAVMTNEGKSLLHMACLTRSKECVRRLLESGMNPDVLDRGGVTPLVVSVRNNQKEIVKTLLDSGADIRAKDNDGDEGIHIAVMHGFKDMLMLLLENGSEIDVLNNQGLSPLHLAAYFGYKDIFKLLLERGADSDVKTGAGKSCIDIASENGHRELIELIAIMQKRIK